MPKKPIWDSPLKDYIFENRWKERALEEGSHLAEINENTEDEALGAESAVETNQQLQTYLDMVESIGEDEELKGYLAGLERAIVNYYQSIGTLPKMRSDLPLDRRQMEDSDWSRKIMHNAVVDNLSIFSRAYVRKKGINYWRIKIDEGRGDRERIGNWVKAVAPFVQKKMQQQNPG